MNNEKKIHNEESAETNPNESQFSQQNTKSKEEEQKCKKKNPLWRHWYINSGVELDHHSETKSNTSHKLDIPAERIIQGAQHLLYGSQRVCLFQQHLYIFEIYQQHLSFIAEQYYRCLPMQYYNKLASFIEKETTGSELTKNCWSPKKFFGTRLRRLTREKYPHK